MAEISLDGGILGLIAQCHLTWKRYLQRRLVKHGVTLKQLYVLSRLAENASLFPAEIAELIYSDRPTASSIIRNLEKKGWVSRSIDPNNARRTLIAISGDGRSKISSIKGANVFSGPDFARPLRIFSKPEIQRVEENLGRLLDHLREVTT